MPANSSSVVITRTDSGRSGTTAATFSDVGWNVENYGTDPDIEVDIFPQDYAKGVDPQMERAILEAMKLLETHPPQPPDFSSKPIKAAPKLPK